VPAPHCFPSHYCQRSLYSPTCGMLSMRQHVLLHPPLPTPLTVAACSCVLVSAVAASTLARMQALACLESVSVAVSCCSLPCSCSCWRCSLLVMSGRHSLASCSSRHCSLVLICAQCSTARHGTCHIPPNYLPWQTLHRTRNLLACQLRSLWVIKFHEHMRASPALRYHSMGMFANVHLFLNMKPH
jgi:hypothetical protein